MGNGSAHSGSTTFDVIVVGSGAGGLSLALNLADRASVAILTKRSLSDSNTSLAQGGIAAVLDPLQDDPEQHIADTLTAGAGLCRRDTVERVVHAGPAAIAQLRARGVMFDTDGHGQLHLTREGGHSARRVAHQADSTGFAIESALVQRVREHPNIAVFERHQAVDLITRARLARRAGRGTPGWKGDRVLGVYALDIGSDRVEAFGATVVCLATGGAGKIYLYTTNPDVATGDGVAMAWRAGAKVANMEFFQFHPTCLYHQQAKNFLISEALRGEGGILRNRKGEAFMPRFDPRKDLAPRDIVARAIDSQLKESGDECAYLDMTHLPADFLEAHFPMIHDRCMQLGIDMRSQPIPVVPAAHYQCGGVQVDADGQTSIDGLLAVGEVACTGLHGANRLASNSLLEAVVYAERAAAKALIVLDQRGSARELHVPAWDTGSATNPDEQVVVTQSWDEIRRLMWNYVGIVRSSRRLLRAQRRLQLIAQEVQQDWWRFYLTPDLIELRNITTVSLLVVESALARQESRGLHWSIDYPQTDDENWARDSVTVRSGS
ncbi:MAG: L-aspartate oxidase [Myxococcales bacterium]|nr:L-aspartate oxidase [Myxococcales bacterium]